MDDHQTSLTLREYPFVAWIAGDLLILAGFYFYFSKQMQLITMVLLIMAGLVLYLVSTVLTVTADRLSQTVTLRYRAPLWGSKKEIPLNDVAAVQLETSRGSDGSTYRIVIVRKDGQVVPFHSYYSSGTKGKQKRAGQLRAFLGVDGQDEIPFSLLKPGLQMVQEKFQEQQEALTGSQAEEQITDGVHWKLQTIAFGESAVTRWFSPDCNFPNGFMFLTQKVAGQKTMAGGLIGGVGKFLYQQAIKLYGFGNEDTPGLETAELLAPLDANLESNFSAITSDPAAARQILNPWLAAPLADWAVRYPLKQMQTQGLFGQLAVLFSPRGIYVACMGTMIPEALEELTNLGVALVKAGK